MDLELSTEQDQLRQAVATLAGRHAGMTRARQLGDEMDDALLTALGDAGFLDVVHDAGPLEGAFYAFVDITSTGMTDKEFSDKLYDEHRVATVPGSAFGTAGHGRVRVSYAAEESVLREGMRRLAGAIKAWDRTAAKV